MVCKLKLPVKQRAESTEPIKQEDDRLPVIPLIVSLSKDVILGIIGFVPCVVRPAIDPHRHDAGRANTFQIFAYVEAEFQNHTVPAIRFGDNLRLHCFPFPYHRLPRLPRSSELRKYGC